MNRAIDNRSDFYSLGVTFYELLTGQLPYKRTRDSMEIVHSHIAVEPKYPHEVKPEIPVMLSKIVMKLMQKNAEQRYQSAFGLRSDLKKCREQLQQSGVISEFTPGVNDRSEKFHIPEKLYGRQKEIELLVNEVQNPLVENRGYFISGKFDQFKRDIPYSAIIQAFQDLVRQILTEDKVKIEHWKNELVAVLGNSGKIIVDVIPDVGLIVGEQPPVVELPPAEAEIRFNSVFLNFVRTFSQKSHPLVIFLDDLQWADTPSLKLLQLLLTDSDLQYLFMLGAYRDNEVDAAHPLIHTLQKLKQMKIEINNLELGPLNWDAERIKSYGITDNVVELMEGKITVLGKETQNLMKLASCIGNTFELSVLSIVSEKSENEIAKSLRSALKEGLIIPIGINYKIAENTEEELKDINVSYKFPHDRVQQAAYNLLNEEERAQTHITIGRHVLENSSPEEVADSLIEIVNHLNAGLSTLQNPPKLRNWPK